VLEHGASGFILFSPSGGTTDIVSLGRWATEIVPAIREAISKENTPSIAADSKPSSSTPVTARPGS
jgi:hypothetical protein